MDTPNAGPGRGPAAVSLVHVLREPAPGALAAGERPPVLLLLHGVGSNERSMARIAPSFDSRLLVICARSPLVLGDDSFGWFHVTFTAEGPVIDCDEAEAGWKAVARFVNEAVQAYGADPARVYVGGFSQGGIIALAALLTSPARIAGALVMSGRLLPEVLPHAAPVESLRGKALCIVHGTNDEKLGIHYARWAREQLARFPVELTYRELAMGHQVTRESVGEASAWLTGALLAAGAQPPIAPV